MREWRQVPEWSRAYSSSSTPHIQYDVPCASLHGTSRSQVPTALRAGHGDPRPDEMARKSERRLGQSSRDGRPATRHAEDGPSVPFAVLREQRRRLLGRRGQSWGVDDPTPLEAPVDELPVAGLELVDGEYGLEGLDARLQRAERVVGGETRHGCSGPIGDGEVIGDGDVIGGAATMFSRT